MTSISYGYGANILGFFTTPSLSHQQTFQTICKELASRGHNVTFISPNILNDTSIKNLTEIDISQVYAIHKSIDAVKYLSKDAFTVSRVLGYYILTRVPTEIALLDSKVQKLINTDERFDLLLVQAFHPLTFAMAARFKVPVIGK